jgi:outer membrane protein TolC
MDPGDEANLPSDDTRPEEPYQELEKSVPGLPQVRAADRDADAAEKLAWAQRLAVVPVVGAQFTETATNATGFTGRSTSYTAGIGLTWRLDVPTFMLMGSTAANERVADLAAEKARLQSRDQIHSDWQRFNSSLTKLDAAKAQQQAAERAAQVARDRYAAGAATQLDVIAAERDLFSAEVGQIQARTELAAARLGLRISSGQPLGLE